MTESFDLKVDLEIGQIKGVDKAKDTVEENLENLPVDFDSRKLSKELNGVMNDLQSNITGLDLSELDFSKGIAGMLKSLPKIKEMGEEATTKDFSVTTPEELKVAVPDEVPIAKTDEIKVVAPDELSVASPNEISVATPNEINVAQTWHVKMR